MRLGDNLCHNDPSGQRAYKCSQQRESGLGNEIRQRVQILSSGGEGVLHYKLSVESVDVDREEFSLLMTSYNM